MSPAREFLLRLVVTPPSIQERRLAGGLLFAGTILVILWGGQILAWAMGIEP